MVRDDAIERARGTPSRPVPARCSSATIGWLTSPETRPRPAAPSSTIRGGCVRSDRVPYLCYARPRPLDGAIREAGGRVDGNERRAMAPGLSQGIDDVMKFSRTFSLALATVALTTVAYASKNPIVGGKEMF